VPAPALGERGAAARASIRGDKGLGRGKGGQIQALGRISPVMRALIAR